MGVPQNGEQARDAGRRRFMRLAALGAVGAAAWALLRGGLPLPGRQRSLPRDLPGKGSIFQPRKDPRYPAG